MVAWPIDWRGLLENWVWPLGYTAALISFVPLVLVLYGLPEDWFALAVTILAYVAVHIVLFGIPATLILSKMQQESFGAYCAFGLISSWILPIYFYLKQRAFLQSISNMERLEQGLEHTDIMMLYFGVIGTPLSIIATAIWWLCNRRPKLEAAGIIPPPQGYSRRLF